MLILVLAFACSESEDLFQMDKPQAVVPEIRKSNDKRNGEPVFFIVEEMPGFQGGGTEKFRDYITQNIRYPEIAKEKGIQGRVYIQFAVNSAGEVVDAVVVRGIDPALDKEAIRVVMSSPRWEPGRQRGENVKVVFTFPVNFVLPEPAGNQEQHTSEL